MSTYVDIDDESDWDGELLFEDENGPIDFTGAKITGLIVDGPNLAVSWIDEAAGTAMASLTADQVESMTNNRVYIFKIITITSGNKKKTWGPYALRVL